MPEVTYFVESIEEAAHNGMSRPDFLEQRVLHDQTLQKLHQTRGAISLALGELNLTDVCKKVNAHGVPLDIWPVLTDAEGYWNCRWNIDDTRQHVGEILNWKEKHGVAVRSIGIDLEPHIEMMKDAAPSRLRSFFGRLMRGHVHEALQNTSSQKKLEGLIDEIHDNGMTVDVYKMIFMGEVPPVRHLMGVHKVPRNADTVAKMIYTSHRPVVSVKNNLWRGEIPALGILSGTGVNPGREITAPITDVPLLTDEQLGRDVSQVRGRGLDRFYVFALNDESVIHRVQSAWGKAEGAR